MSGMLKHIEFEQPASFAFSPENLKEAQRHINKYPAGRQASAVLPLLDLAQRQAGGWVPRAAMDAIATMLEMPFIRVYEVATFYTMFNLQPVGKHLIQVCRTTPCWLRGSDAVTDACRNKLGIDIGETTADGKFTMVEVECLGACVNAPVIQINDDFYEDLNAANIEAVLDALSAGKQPAIGSQIGRQTSAPEGGTHVLKEVPKKAAAKAATPKEPAAAKPVVAEKAPAKPAPKPAAKRATKPKGDGNAA